MSHVASHIARPPTSRLGQVQKEMGLSEGEPLKPKALAEMLVPLRPADLHSALGALTIQRVARARGARQRLEPRLAPRLLRLRGAMHIQRWWRTWLVLERVRMLSLVKARAAAVNTNKLYLRKALFEALSGRPPLHATELWPEHRLRLSFTPPPEAAVQLSPPEPNAVELAAGDPPLRPGLPTWSAPVIQATRYYTHTPTTS